MDLLEKRKLLTLVDEYGGNINKILSETIMDSLCPAICMNEDCNATYDYEPDQERGWCEKCNTNSVKSILIIYGVY